MNWNWFMMVVSVLHFAAAIFEIRRGNVAFCIMYTSYGIAAAAVATQGG